MELHGRRIIYSCEERVTAENVVSVIDKALVTHLANRSEIVYLYRYYRGDQPILQREKTIRPEINNKIVVNHANSIVNFKVGYIAGEPIQYVGREGEDAVTADVKELNDLMSVENKNARDKDVIRDMMICGTGYRMVLPDASDEEDEAPFEIYGLEPWNTFVIYSSAVGHKPLCAVYVTYQDDYAVDQVANVYTDREFFAVHNGAIERHEFHALGAIPIIEYPADRERLGSFEVVLPLLDAINTVQSNRVDGVEQFVQSLMKFKNCDYDDDQIERIRELGAVKIKTTAAGMDADVELMTQELNQDQTQTLTDYLYKVVQDICGIPARNSGSGDNGIAVVYRDGWSDAETRAKNTEESFKESEMSFLKIVLRICSVRNILHLSPKDLDVHFTRRNYEAVQSKVQSLVQMLNCDDIHPLDAWKISGVTPDPEQAYKNGQGWKDEQVKTAYDELVQENRRDAEEVQPVADEEVQQSEEQPDDTGV